MLRETLHWLLMGLWVIGAAIATLLVVGSVVMFVIVFWMPLLACVGILAVLALFGSVFYN